MCREKSARNSFVQYKTLQIRQKRLSFKKQYVRFRKLLSASSRDIPLSEIVDCIDKVVVDSGGKIVVKWNKL